MTFFITFYLFDCTLPTCVGTNQYQDVTVQIRNTGSNSELNNAFKFRAVLVLDFHFYCQSKNEVLTTFWLLGYLVEGVRDPR